MDNTIVQGNITSKGPNQLPASDNSIKSDSFQAFLDQNKLSGDDSDDNQTLTKRIILDPSKSSEEERMAESMESLASSFNALTIRLDPFDGSGSIQPEDFVADFKRYLRYTGKESPRQIKDVNGRLKANRYYGQLEKDVLKMHLKGAAKIWFNGLDKKLSYKDCLTQFVERFKITDEQKHMKKLAVFQTKQQPTETFEAFVSRLLNLSSGLKIPEKDLVAMATQGALAPLKHFLIMAKPTTMTELMALPLARDSALPEVTGYRNEFVGMTDVKEACTRCGYKSCRSLLSADNYCIAKGKTCYRCGFRNHLIRCCKTGLESWDDDEDYGNNYYDDNDY